MSKPPAREEVDPPTSTGKASTRIDQQWIDKIGILALEAVFGDSGPLESRKHWVDRSNGGNPQEIRTLELRKRLVDELRQRVEVRDDVETAYREIRDRELPTWTSPLLGLNPEEQLAHSRDNPWRLRRGWELEPELPVKLGPRKAARGRDVQDEPLEPGYAEYNRLTRERFLRPFRTANGQPRCAVPTAFGLEVRDPRSGPRDHSFIDAIAYREYTLQGAPIPTRDLLVAAKAIEQRALARDLPGERVVDLAIRVARGPAGECLLDLADSRHRCIRITSQGWTVEPIGYPLFDAPGNLRELPVPEQSAAGSGGWARIEQLWRFLSLEGPSDDGDQRLLAVTQLVHFLVAPDSPRPISVVVGPEGSGKTATASRLQELVDPSIVPYLGAPKDEEKLTDLAYNRATINLDNVSRIPLWLSDALCRMSTGAGEAKRELYTDRGEVAVRRNFWFILNGITANPQLADLIRRCVFYTATLPRSTEDPTELDLRFRVAHPQILGGLLDLAVRVLRVLEGPAAPVGDGDGMAGFVRVGRAVARACGRPDSDFDFAWAANQDRRNAAAEEDPWYGVLRSEFGAVAVGGRITAAKLASRISESHRETFPEGVSSQQVGNALARAKRTLERNGIRWTRKKDSAGDWYYYRISLEMGSVGSVIESFSEEKAGRNLERNPNGTSNGGSVPATEPEMAGSVAGARVPLADSLTVSDPPDGTHGTYGTHSDTLQSPDGPVMEESGNWTVPPRDRARPRDDHP